MLFRIVVVSWAKVIVGLNPRTVGDSILHAIRPVWTAQQNAKRRNTTTRNEKRRDLSGHVRHGGPGGPT